MRISSSVTVGSPMARAAAIMVATLLLALTVAGAGIAGSRLLAADGAIIVAQDGGGHYTSIQEAVDAAEPGDEIIVKPGTYVESVTIAEDITLRGEDRQAVIVEFGQGCEGPTGLAGCPPGSPVYSSLDGTGPFGILVEDGTAQISDLTIRGPEGVRPTGSIVATGGGPSFSGITVVGSHPMYIEGGSAASISDSDLSAAHGFVIEPSLAVVETSSFLTLVVNSDPAADDGPGPVLRGNRAHGITLEAPATVEQNEITPSDEPLAFGPTYGSGIDVIEGATFIIRENEVSGFDGDVGIDTGPGSHGEISGNTVSGTRVGVSVGSGETIVHGNTVSDAGTGYVLNGAVDFSENSAESITGRAVVLGARAVATLSGNRACGNEVDLFIEDGADATMREANEFCIVEQPE